MTALVTLWTVFGVWSLSRGQDVNFDQRNYHVYGVWALFHDRFAVDFAPAGIGTFLMPYHNVPFVYSALNAPPRLTGFLVGAGQGTAAWLVAVIAWRVLPGYRRTSRTALAALATIVGAWSPGVIVNVGTSFGDVSTAIPLLAGIALICRPTGAPSATVLISAGALAGISVALKPTNMVYAAAIFAVLMAFCLLRRLRFRALVAYAVATGSAFLIASAYWMWLLWDRYESPVFPQFNNVFRSPYYPPTATADSRWRVRGLADALDTPLEFVTSPTRFGEIALRDARWLVLAFVAGAAVVIRRNLLAALRTTSFGALFVVMFVVVGFVLWLALWTYHRYLVPVELLSGVALLLLLRRFIVDHEAMVAAYAVAVASILVSVVGPDHGHLPWGSSWYGTRLPAAAFQDNVMVVMSTAEPISYVIPSFPESVRFVRVYSQSFMEGQETRYTADMRSAIDHHRGPLLMMAYQRDLPIDESRLGPYSLVLDATRCEAIRNRLESDLVLCPLRRTG